MSLLLSWLKFAESRLHLILRPMYAGYLSILRSNDFRCIFRYYYGVNANTGKQTTSLDGFDVCPPKWRVCRQKCLEKDATKCHGNKFNVFNAMCSNGFFFLG